MIQWFKWFNDSMNWNDSMIQWFNDSMIQWFNELKWFNDSNVSIDYTDFVLSIKNTNVIRENIYLYTLFFLF